MQTKKYLLPAVSWISFFAGYLLFAGKLQASESVAGGIAAASTAWLFHFIYARRAPRFLPLKWMTLLPLLPKAMIGETWLLIAAMFPRRSGRVLHYPYRIREASPRAAAVRAFVTYGVCFSPNSYLIDFDPQERVIMIRQLVGNSLSASDESFLELQ